MYEHIYCFHCIIFIYNIIYFRAVQVPAMSAGTQEHVSADHRSDDGTADDQQPGVI